MPMPPNEKQPLPIARAQVNRTKAGDATRDDRRATARAYFAATAVGAGSGGSYFSTNATEALSMATRASSSNSQ